MADAMQDAILNGLYDSSYPGSETLGPSILSNNHDEKIWSILRNELYSCSSVYNSRYACSFESCTC